MEYDEDMENITISSSEDLENTSSTPLGNEDLPKLLENVPEEYKADIEGMSLKMITHPAYEKPYEWSTEDFELGAPLGRGKFGRVYIARERQTQYLVAMKILFKNELQKANAQGLLLREIEIQSRLKHPNILRMFTWFHDETRIYLAIELASKGELYTHLRKAPNHRFDEPRAAKYVNQVADALDYCHLNHVIHRDLKPENLLLTSTDDIKLADFGWSVHTPSNKRTTLCGTLDYIPPEMVASESYDSSIDQWCLGVLCYEFLVGEPPFQAVDSATTYKRIRNLTMKYPVYLSAGAKDLISKLLCKEGYKRLALTEVMTHPWVKENTAKRNEHLKRNANKIENQNNKAK